ncbi:hypothetical protein KUL156_35450 [Alteromonas sp. KUL156]|uniref:Sugar transporter n=1 Tax=Tenacibaculum sp. Pbs-1 TaxID=3238748 RepID=A0AB33KTZ5_9FLAO|nr:hypothetical protein BACY1_28250 [Tenacibaculum mesophilum]GFD82807.1 hypothetical protein KUL118_56690 [Tenacibaculum sp. KUL118]GFD93038.1 hypothetical protein KUL154_17710 [Alteromonas sp. KUL154]GFE00953.1 hypothetical protein KUL156_35450 [Alteromonas sp. KUL156]
MTDSNKPATLFWIIGIAALVWNGLGVMSYIGQAYMTDEVRAALPEAERALYENVPTWVTAAFAIAVFGGLLGSAFLLMRKKLARPMFLISLIAIIVQMSYNLFMSRASEVYGPGSIIMPIMVIVIGVFLLMYSKKTIAKGWLS